MAGSSLLMCLITPLPLLCVRTLPPSRTLPCLRCPLPLLLLCWPLLLLRGLSDCCPSLLLCGLPVLLWRSLKGQHGSRDPRQSAKVAKKYAPAQGERQQQVCPQRIWKESCKTICSCAGHRLLTRKESDKTSLSFKDLEGVAKSTCGAALACWGCAGAALGCGHWYALAPP